MTCYELLVVLGPESHETTEVWVLGCTYLDHLRVEYDT